MNNGGRTLAAGEESYRTDFDRYLGAIVRVRRLKCHDTSVPYEATVDELLAHVCVPISHRVIGTNDLSPANTRWIRRRFGHRVDIRACPLKFIWQVVERRYRVELRKHAETGLAACEPQFSASTVITPEQSAIFTSLLIALALMCAIAPDFWIAATTSVLGFLFVANGLFRAILLWGRGATKLQSSATFETIPDDALPIYTILVPLYRETCVLPALVRALCALDYPKDRLDIKLVVEADDYETARAADAAAFAPWFSVIRVPPGGPRTKPRACNYALPFARGEFTVIFDAEDRPEPDQLRKAVRTLRNFPANVACVQARLGFYNARDCWLTEMFDLDYRLWFGFLLPGLDRLNIPMPLGGTSNHFRTAALRDIHAWDPYNVTEDADIGIRLARVGMRVRLLDSTTFEEATSHIFPWLRQRSRWLKGYMQTWLVHMRSPRTLLRNAGVAGFIGFQLFIAGTFLSALLNPVLWGIFLISHFFGHADSKAIAHTSLFGLALGNSLFAYLALLTPSRRDWINLAPYGLTAPLYWLLISYAGIRALIQLCIRPWYWDKTPHGLSSGRGGNA